MARLDLEVKVHKTLWFIVAFLFPRLLLRFHPKAVICYYYINDKKTEITISEVTLK